LPVFSARLEAKPDTDGSQENCETGRMNHVVMAAQNKPFQTDQGTYGQKGFYRGRPRNIGRRLASAPEIKKVKPVSGIKAEKSKPCLDKGPECFDPFWPDKIIT
jgi:hypothetical protein